MEGMHCGARSFQRCLGGEERTPRDEKAKCPRDFAPTLCLAVLRAYCQTAIPRAAADLQPAVLRTYPQHCPHRKYLPSRVPTLKVIVTPHPQQWSHHLPRSKFPRSNLTTVSRSFSWAPGIVLLLASREFLLSLQFRSWLVLGFWSRQDNLLEHLARDYTRRKRWLYLQMRSAMLKSGLSTIETQSAPQSLQP